jgi:fructose-1,6-bisphosphatase II
VELKPLDRHLGLEFVRVTEAAALSCARWKGRGERAAADAAAVKAMRTRLNDLDIDATIVIGEGERDEAPMLYIGEQLGRGRNGAIPGCPVIDVAVDPVEGTNLVATGSANAISVMAAAIVDEGKLLRAPDTYLMKLAVGPAAQGAINLDDPVATNLHRIAEALGRQVRDITVTILDRERHADLINDVRRAGARIQLISDGDVSACIAAASDTSGVDVLYGIGGAPEGVLAAAALKCMGGDMQCRFHFRNAQERERAAAMGIADFAQKFGIEDLAVGHVTFVATGITNGDLLRGVRFTAHGAETNSIVMRSKTGTVRELTTHHRFTQDPQ